MPSQPGAFVLYLVMELRSHKTSQVALVVKNLPASAGDIRDMGLILGWEEPLEKGMATHSSILTWRISWTEEPGGLQVDTTEAT